MTERQIPPAGQVVNGWLAVHRIPDTRTWLMRCTTCSTELRVSSIALGKALGLGEPLPDCAGCADAPRILDLNALPDEGDDIIEAFESGRPVHIPGVGEVSIEVDDTSVLEVDDTSVLDPEVKPLLASAVEPGWVAAGIAAIRRGSLSPSRDPEPELTPELVRERLLTPFRREMAQQQRNAQSAPGPSAVGGCQRKLAHQILYPEEFVAQPSGWASMRGTVMHAWAAKLLELHPFHTLGWKADVALPKVVHSVTGGTLDLWAMNRVVDNKFPGDWSWKRIVKGYRSEAYLAQLQVYGLGATMLGLKVEAVGLLIFPPNDKFEDTIYDEWPYDEEKAWAHLDRAELHRIHGRGRRADHLAEVPIMDDFCNGCLARKNGHCKGYAVESDAAWSGGNLGLTLERG